VREPIFTAIPIAPACIVWYAAHFEEERYLPHAQTLSFSSSRLEEDGESFLPAGSFHQLRAVGDSVTIHAYAPRPEVAVSELSEGDRVRIDRARRTAGAIDRGITRSTFHAHDHFSITELAQRIASDWATHERDALARGENRLPRRILEDIRSSGILAAPLPRHLGALSSDLHKTASAVSIIAERAPAAAVALVMPLGNAATCRIPLSAVEPHQVGSLRASQRWIAEQISRGKILAVANSESGTGGSLANSKTIAHIDANGIAELTGRKTFATIGTDADFFLCAARSADSEAGGTPRVDGFFIHRDAPGLAIDDAWNAFGMRTTASVGLQLESTPPMPSSDTPAAWNPSTPDIGPRCCSRPCPSESAAPRCEKGCGMEAVRRGRALSSPNTCSR
jgi:hypothetical protein